MKINPVNSFFPKINSKQNNAPIHYNRGLEKDTFQRSEVSFGSSFFEDDNFFMAVLTGIDSLIFSSFLDEIGDIVRHIEHEGEFSAYLSIFSDKRIKNLISKMHETDMLKINDAFFKEKKDKYAFVDDILTDAKITTYMQLQNFIKGLNSNPEVKKAFKGQEIEAAKIYGLLNSKSSLSSYGDILLCCYNREEESYSPDFGRINTYAEFLSNLRVRDSKAFEEKFAHLVPYYNDFSTIEDKTDALEYVMETYEDKIHYLDEIIEYNPELRGQKAENIYSTIPGIIDTLYDDDEGYGLSDLDEYIIQAMNFPKLKSSAIRTFSPIFNGFKSPDDEIEFLRFINDSNITIKDINELSTAPIVSDVDTLSYLLNYEDLTAEITELKGGDKKAGAETYKAFKDTINALYEDKDDEKGLIPVLISVIDKYKIKNNEAFMAFFNKVNSSKKKSITSSELREFIRLFEGYDGHVLEEAKKQKVPPIAVLKTEANKREDIIFAIEEFLSEDVTGYFAGKTSEEIYLEYKSHFDKGAKSVSSVLGDIVNFNIGNSSEYAEKSGIINSFEGFFKDRKSLMEFILKNKFKFDGSNEDNAYINASYTILSDISKKGKKSDIRKRVEYFANSGFLSRSMKKLPSFLERFEDENQRKELLETIADKEIPSVQSLNRFIQNYEGQNGETKNLYTFIKNIPQGVDFTKATDTLDTLKNASNRVNAPVHIDNDNILNIDIKYFTNKNIVTTSSLNKFLREINGVQSGSFVKGLTNAFDEVPETFSRFKIAREIADKADKTGESYRNLISSLHIDKAQLGLDENASSYMYVKAIERVLPKEFVDFVNSPDWLDYKNNGEIPSFSLHAKLRAIDRFPLNENPEINSLYTKETKEKLKAVIASVYETEPSDIKGTDVTKRIITDTKTASGEIETVFGQNGEVITIVPVGI